MFILMTEREQAVLKLKYLFENYGLAKKALENWEHDTDDLKEMLSRFRISSNAIYPFRRSGEVCFLRLAPVEEKRKNNVLGELEFVSWLRANGYPALEPVCADSGELCLQLDTEWGEYYATVFHAVPGAALEAVELSPDVLFAYGKTLGRLHALSRAYVPQIRKWNHLDALDWTAETLAAYSASECMIEEAAALREALAALPVDTDSYGLVHYDFEPDNVFYDRDSGCCAVIDFDDGMYHWYALDVEQALDSLSEQLDEGAMCAAAQDFCRGYRSERELPDDTDAIRPLMRRFVDLFGYARVLRCVAERFENEPEWMAGLRRHLDQILRAREQKVTGRIES